MAVLDLTRSNDSTLHIRRSSLTEPAIALSTAAAVAGVVELLLDRIAAPVLTHAVGPSLGWTAAFAARVGSIAVGVTAILVLIAAVAWAAAVGSRHPLPASAVAIAVVVTLVAMVVGRDVPAGAVHGAVIAAAVAALAIVHRVGHRYVAAFAAVAAAIVAGQLALLRVELALPARTVAEAAAVVALLLFAFAVSRLSLRRSLIGLAIGAVVAAAALATDRTALVALWAAGATLWMPSLVYICAGGAAGVLVANSLPDRATRPLVAGLALLAVAGLEPALIHHNVTALVGLLVLGMTVERTSA